MNFAQASDNKFINFDLNKTIVYSRYDGISNKILLYDINKNFILFNVNNLKIDLIRNYSDDLISSFYFYDNKIYTVFQNGDFVIFDDKINVLLKKSVLNFTKNIDKIYFNKNKIYIVYDYKNLLIFDITTDSKKNIQNIQKINSLSFSNDTFCVAGWNKMVECDESKIMKFKSRNILTSLFYCAYQNEFIAGDIDGNIYFLLENSKFSISNFSPIKDITCSKKNYFISTDNKEIYVLKDKEMSLLTKEDSEIIDIFIDKNDKLIFVNKNGSIKLYNKI